MTDSSASMGDRPGVRLIIERHTQIGNGDEHLGSVTALAYLGTTDGVLASGCSDSYLRLFDVNQRRMIARFSAQEDEVLCIANHEWIPSVVLSGGADSSAMAPAAGDRRTKLTKSSLTLSGAPSRVAVGCENQSRSPT